jgi:hypothetical protein
MRSYRRGARSLVVLAALALVPGEAWPQGTTALPPEKKGPAAPPSPKPADMPKPKLDIFRFPADAVIVIARDLADALAGVANPIVLSREKYQEMLDEIAHLREQLGPRKSAPPSRCQLTGKVENGLLSLKAQFDFVTDRPDTVVALACDQAVATAADIDGHTPLFRPESVGFNVVVDKPGEHQVKLDLVVGLTAREGAPAIDLPLPRAAVTTIDLELPKGAIDLRLGNRPLARTLSFKDGKLTGGLGPAERLDLTYKEPRPPAAIAVPVAEGRIVVRVGPDGITTEAELTLSPEGGMMNLWQIVVPRGAMLRLAPEDQARLAGPIENADQPVGSLRTLRLGAPSAAPLKVSITDRGPKLKPGTAVPIGPFTVVGAARQSGLLLVSNTIPELHLDYRIRAGLRRQALPADEDRQAEPNLSAVFRYGGVAPDTPPKGAARSSWYGPWLELEAETVRGQIKAHVSHQVRLQADGKDGFIWTSTTTIEAVPRWADVDQLKVLLPAGWVSTEEAEKGSPPAGERVVIHRLLRGPGEAAGRVTLTLQGRYVESYRGEGEVRLQLPRPVGVIDEGADITLSVNADRELLAPAVAGSLETVQMAPHEQIWRSPTLPEGITAAWKPYIPDVRVESIADIDLTAERADVWRHEFHLQLPQPPPETLSVRVPPGIDSLQIQKGGTLIATTDPTRRLVRLEKGGMEKRLLVLRYLVRGGLPGNKPASIPLVAIEPAAQTEVRARLWCPPGRQPVLVASGVWRESAIEEVQGRSSLPVLVARTTKADAPLVLQGVEAAALDTVLVERLVVRVQIADNGTQLYVVRLRLRRLAAGAIEVELPGPIRAMDLQARLDQRQVVPEPLDDTGRPSESGRVARLRLSGNLIGDGAVLELQYQMSPGRALASTGDPGPLATLLPPPIVRDCPGPVPYYWQVRVPAGWVVLSPESGPGADRVWSWRGRLPALKLRTPPVEEEAEPGEAGALDVLCWRSSPVPLLLVHVPQQTWLLTCSLLSVVVGLLLLGGRSGQGVSRWRAFAGVLLLVGIAVTGALRPAILAAILYGCQPGVLVLAVFLLFQWLLHERYRRQIVFLPSFSRKRSGSSMKPSPAGPGEPSTVDHTRPAGSSGARR